VVVETESSIYINAMVEEVDTDYERREKFAKEARKRQWENLNREFGENK
jgi:hypothetical protein